MGIEDFLSSNWWILSLQMLVLSAAISSIPKIGVYIIEQIIKFFN
jgi:hypothetical protein